MRALPLRAQGVEGVIEARAKPAGLVGIGLGRAHQRFGNRLDPFYTRRAAGTGVDDAAVGRVRCTPWPRFPTRCAVSTGSPESAYQTGTPATTPSSSCLFRSRARLIHRRDLTQAVRHVRRFRHHRRGPRPVRCTVQGTARRVTGDRFASPQSFSVNRVRHITTSVCMRPYKGDAYIRTLNTTAVNPVTPRD